MKNPIHNQRRPSKSSLVSFYSFLWLASCGFLISTLLPNTSYGQIRFATFNVSMNRSQEGELSEQLAAGNHEQIAKIAAVIRTIRPDVLLLNEFDYAGEQATASVEHFQNHYLQSPSDTLKPIEYGYAYTNQVNTGIASGLDLDGNGKTTDPTDCFGFGRYPGQYGMVVLSRFPLGEVRTFQKFLWQNMPGALLPRDPKTGKSYYSSEILNKFRLSSKSHWDVPVETPAGRIHFLVCHPTPPVFDGPEDKNGTRNHDEIRFWSDYVSPSTAGYIVDDAGQRGGLRKNEFFVIAGDLNADPVDGDSTNEAINQLLKHPLIQDPKPTSKGGAEAAKIQGNVNTTHRGKAELDTGDFSDRSPGNLRIDYVLPSRNLKTQRAGVFWPTKADTPATRLVTASDHRMVWVDIKVKEK